MNKSQTDTQRAPRNRTLTVGSLERTTLLGGVVDITSLASVETMRNRVALGDSLEIIEAMPRACVDLLIADPPYNMDKDFHGNRFREKTTDEYADWLDSWISKCIPLLKQSASVYICGDWKSSSAIFSVCSRYFKIRNRITWEREKGRGALSNWKNCSEDIWFCTVSDDYFFDVDKVKMMRKVIAPYRDSSGNPKDWQEGESGNFRLTYPSNLWTDISVPFWSMPENTDHPTQKPEKLIAKLVLASSKPGDLVFDPFLGSGTTAVVAKKLARNFFGIEMNEEYVALAMKRLQIADEDSSIQGYRHGLFWERNTSQAVMDAVGVGESKQIIGSDTPPLQQGASAIDVPPRKRGRPRKSAST